VTGTLCPILNHHPMHHTCKHTVDMLAANKQLFSPAAAARGVLLTARGAGRPWPVAKRAEDSDL
jgi:hypothetical protein